MSASEGDPSKDDEPLSSPSVSNYHSTSEPSRGRFTSKYQVKKRKAFGDAAARSQSRIKRLKPMYSSEYLQLFNTALNELIARKNNSKRSEGLETSQIGISIWSAEEKHALFQSLARKGRLDIKAVAAAVVTKSDSEICVYLDLLRQSATRRELDASRRRLTFDLSSIEAAAEIGVDCHAALENSADALSLLQYREEEKTEREKHPQTWLLAPGIAKWADQGLKAGAEQEQEILSLLPAAALLNLSQFLRLSKHYFMNSSDLDRNWLTYTERKKVPSIMHSAFQDFHTLTVSLTKRLISSALFLASSRIRAETLDFGAPKLAVRRKDVLAALQILGMELSSKRTWVNMARKCNLRVFENVRYKRAWGKRYTYDEVEQHLSTYEYRRGRYRSKTRNSSLSEGAPSQPVSDNEDSQSQRSEIMDDEPASPSDSATASEGTSPSNHSESLDSPSTEDEESKLERQERLQDAYMESLDQRESQTEERRLWEMLGEDPAAKMDLADVELPPKPAPPSRKKEVFVDWRDWTDYAADWELLEGRVPEESFLANRLVGRTGGEGELESSSDVTESSRGNGERRRIEGRFSHNEEESEGV